MTAPDAQPPAELASVNPHWSPTVGLLWWEDGTYVTVEGGEIVEDGFALPADAVRLVADPGASVDDAPERVGRLAYAVIKDHPGLDPQGLAAHIADALLAHDLIAAPAEESTP